jgi:aminoglycoside 6'-N-acetyltransferase I
MHSHINVRRLMQEETVPYELLLLADPSKGIIDSYLMTSDVYIAESGADIIAVYILYPVDQEIIEIKNIAVAKNHQGQGIGKFLLSHACTVAKEKGFTSIRIGTANSSIAQLGLYQKLGFEIQEIHKDFFVYNYPEPIYENGILAKHLIFLSKSV